MRVAGFGFRQKASLASLQDALARAGGPSDLGAIATADDKAQTPVFEALAHALNLPVVAVDQAGIVNEAVMTKSPKSQQMRGSGSLSEAAALAGAGTGAVLLTPRKISSDKMATCAIAERSEP